MDTDEARSRTYAGRMSMTMDAPAADRPPVTGGPSLPQKRELVTSIPGPKSEAWIARKQAAVSAGVGTMMPVYAVAAGGGVIVDVDGNSLIDLGSGIAVTNVGNADPHVTAAVIEQVQRFTHTCFTITPYDGYVEVAEALNRLTPGDHAKRTALFNSGAEAVENAIKIARYYTGKSAVVAFDHGYHGRTNLTMALTAKAMPYKAGFGPFAPDVYRAPMSYPYRDGLTGEEAAARAIHTMEKQIGADRLAAIIIEPIQGEGGFVVPAPGYLPALQKWANENNVVFIADEVQTGFARTGQMFASEHEGIVPDMITLAKGIAGTYGGNPIATAAALGALAAYDEHDLLGRALELEAIILDELTTMQARDGRIGDIRGRGAMMAIELVDENGAPDAALTSAVAKHCHVNGVVVLTCGTDGNVIRLLPPLSISDDLLREGLGVIAEALEAN